MGKKGNGIACCVVFHSFLYRSRFVHAIFQVVEEQLNEIPLRLLFLYIASSSPHVLCSCKSHYWDGREFFFMQKASFWFWYRGGNITLGNHIIMLCAFILQAA